MFWIPSWADARQKHNLSGLLRFSVFVQSRDASALGFSGYCPGRTPDRCAFSLVFCGFRYPFSRELCPLSGVQVTILGVRPTDARSLWCFAVFGIRSVDSCVRCLVFGAFRYSFSRELQALSGVRVTFLG